MKETHNQTGNMYDGQLSTQKEGADDDDIIAYMCIIFVKCNVCTCVQ